MRTSQTVTQRVPRHIFAVCHIFPFPRRNTDARHGSGCQQNLLVALQLAGRGHGEEAIRPRVVGQRAGKQEARQEPSEGVAVLLEEHQHAVHGLDAKRVVT